MRDFCTMLRQNYSNICLPPNFSSQKSISFIKELYNFASVAHRSNIKQRDWDYLRFKIYLYLSTFDIPEERIPYISLQVQDGILFNACIIQYLLRRNNKIFANDLVDAFHLIVRSILNRKVEIPIYSFSPSFYAKTLPKLVHEALPLDKSRPLFISALNQFVQKKNLSLTDSDLSFFYEITQIFTSTSFYPPELFTFLEYLQAYNKYPIQITSHFFQIWRVALSGIKASPQVEKDKGDNPSQILYDISLMKLHDMPRTFQWHIFFQFFESLSLAPNYQFRDFIFINTISYSIKRFDITSKFDYLARPFLHVMKSMFVKHEEKQSCLYYFFTNVISTISTATHTTNKLKGIQLRHSGSPYVSFGNQQHDKNQVLDIDYDLYTKFDVREFDSLDDEIQYFDKFKRTIDTISKRIHCSMRFNLFEAFEALDLLYFDQKPYSKETAMILFYFRNIIKAWLKFIISFSFRIAMINYYALQGDGLLKIRGPIPNLRRQYDYTLIHGHVKDHFSKLIDSVADPQPIIQLIVDELLSALKYANKRQMLTHHLMIHFLSPLCENKPIIKYRLEHKMIHYLVSNFPQITSKDNKESTFFNQWLLLLFRIGLKPGAADPCFYSLLRSNQRLIVSNVSIYMKQITNATETLKSLDWYRKMLYKTYGNGIPDITEKELIRVRRHLLDEIPLSSYKHALTLVFDRIMTSFSQTNLSQLSTFLISGFYYDDPEMTSNALQAFKPLFQKDVIDNSNNNESDKYQLLFSSLFYAIFNAYPEDALEIIKLLPYTSSFYQKSKYPLTSSPNFIIIEPLGVRIHDLISSISKGLCDSEAESVHLIHLYIHCFTIAKEKFLMNQNEYSDIMTPLLYSIIGLTKFESLKAQISDFLYKQNIEFAKYMVQTHNPCYFLTLYAVMGASRSCLSQFLINVMHNFLSLVKEMNIDESILLEILHEILSCSKTVGSHFNILIGFSMIYKYFPHIFNLNIIQHLLSITSGNIQHDMRYLPMFKKFLKLYLADSSFEVKKQFLQIIYNRIHLIWFGYRFMLIKIVATFNIKFPFKNYDQIFSINKDDIFLMRIMLVFACGIESNEPNLIRPDIKNRIKEILKRIIDNTEKNRAQRALEPKGIASIVFYSILFNEEARNLFFEDSEYVNMALFFLKRLFSFKFPVIHKYGKQIFKKICEFANSPPIQQRISQLCLVETNIKLLDSRLEPILAFFVNIARIIPHNFPPILKIILQAIFDFGRLPDEGKMELLASFLNLIKIVSTKNYITIPDNSAILLEKTDKSKTYYYHLVETFATLIQNNEIPFESFLLKHIKKLFVMFPIDTMNIIIFQLVDLQEPALHLLKLIIPLDETNNLIRIFLNTLHKDISIFHTISPMVFRTLYKIVSARSFVIDEEITLFLNRTFDLFSKEFVAHMNYGLHGFMSMIQISKAYLCVLKHDMSYEHLFSFSNLFLHPGIRSSIIQKKFFSLIQNNPNQEFQRGLLDYSFQTLTKEETKDTYFVERLISHSIDAINPKTNEFQDYLWTLCAVLKDSPRYLTALLIIWTKIVDMTPILYLDKLPEIIQTLPDVFTSGIPYHMDLAFKIVQSLLKYELTPDEVAKRLVAFFIRYGKELETPYAILTMQILKSRQKLLQESSPELEEAFLFFCCDKLPLLKELNKIVFLVQAVPEFLDWLPFPIVPALMNKIRKKIANDKIGDPDIDSSIAAALTSTVKLAMHSQLTDEETSAFFSLCFQFIKEMIMNKRKVKSKDFPDNLCTFITKNGCKNFDLEIINLVASSETKEKYFLGLLAAAAKVLEDDQILACRQVYIDSIRSITFQYNKNQITILFTRLVNSKELWDVFIPEIDTLINKLKGNISNEQNVEVIIFVIQCILKSKVEFDKFKYIEGMWNFMDTLREYSQLKHFYRLMVNIFDEFTDMKYQLRQLRLMIQHSSKSTVGIELLIYTSHVIIKSERVPINIKLQLMDFLNHNFQDIEVDTLERLSELYDDFAQSIQEDLNQYKLRLFIHLMLHTTYNKAIIYAGKAMAILGNTIEDRFKSSYLLLPRLMWNNHLLAPLTLLIFGKECFSGWQSLIVFSKGMKNVSMPMFRSLLRKLGKSEEILIIMRDLLIELYSIPQCNNAITALLTVLNDENCDTNLLASQIYKAPFDFSFDLSHWPVESITDDLLLLNGLNEYILHLFKSENNFNLAAEYQFFLGNYDEALTIFNAEEAKMMSPFDQKIVNLIEKFNNNELYYRTEEEKNVISLLVKAINLIKADHKEEAKPKLNECLSELINVANQGTFSFFDCDFIYSISLIIHQLEHNERPITYSLFYLNPIFQSFFHKLNAEFNYRLDPNSKEPLVLNDVHPDIPYMILPPHMGNLFESINGYDSHGFSYVNADTILQYSSDVVFTNSDRLARNHYEAHQWASLCFSIYCHLQTTILLSASFYSLIGLFDHIDFLPSFITYESTARFITLLRLCLVDKRDKKSIEVCEKAMSVLLTEKYDNKWEAFYFWIRQSIELKSFAPFNQFIQKRSSEYFNVSTEYILGKFAFEDSTNLQFKEALTRMHLNALHSLEELFDFVFDGLDFFEFQEQRSLEKLFYLMKGIYDEMPDLLNLRRSLPVDDFTDHLCELPYSLVEQINDVSLFEKVKNGSVDEIFDLVEYFIPSSQRTYKENKQLLYNMIDHLNTKMPIPLPTRTAITMTASIMMLQYDIRKINNEMFLFSIKTSLMKNNKFIVQRSQDRFSQNISSTFSSVMFILRHIAKYGNSNRTRPIRFSSYIAFDIGPRYSIYSANAQMKTLENVFMMAMGESSKNWIRSSHDVSDLPKDYLLNYFCSKLTKEDYWKQKDFFVNSMASAFFIQHLFTTKYPNLDYFVFCLSSSEIPISFTNINLDFSEREFSTFRLSPNVLNASGVFCKTHIMLVFAAIAQCYVHFDDSIMAFVELLICDQLGTNLNLPQLLAMRTKLNQALLKLAPPKSPGALPSDSAEWIDHLRSLIDKACDCSVQPYDSVPWF